MFARLGGRRTRAGRRRRRPPRTLTEPGRHGDWLSCTPMTWRNQWQLRRNFGMRFERQELAGRGPMPMASIDLFCLQGLPQQVKLHSLGRTNQKTPPTPPSHDSLLPGLPAVPYRASAGRRHSRVRERGYVVRRVRQRSPLSIATMQCPKEGFLGTGEPEGPKRPRSPPRRSRLLCSSLLRGGQHSSLKADAAVRDDPGSAIVIEPD